jgi:uncharacterized membrane protein
MLGRVFGDSPSRTVPSAVPLVPGVRSAKVPASGEPASFDAWRAVLKTFTYRLIVTTVDFGANYIVIGELATAAGMSGMSLVAGPIFYFAHEAAWHYYGPASARQANPCEALVRLRVSGGAGGERNGQTRFASVKVRRALAKTITYEIVTTVSEFSVNYLFVRELATAAGLTGFSVVISPLVYYLHEEIWDRDAAKSLRASLARD